MPEMMTMAPQPPPDGPRCQMVAAAAAILSYPILLTQIVDLKPELGVTPLTAARRTNKPILLLLGNSQNAFSK